MPDQPTANIQLSSSVVAEEKRLRNTRLGLLAPGILTIFCIGIMPLSIVLVYSFLEPGDFGGVSWVLSFDAYVQLLLEEDIFDETLSFTTDYLQIFFRSVSLGIVYHHRLFAGWLSNRLLYRDPTAGAA